MKQILSLLITLLAVTALQAQMVDPVHWQSSTRMTDDTHGVVTLTASIDNGWHLYGLSLPDGGPQATEVEWTALDGVTLDGKLTPATQPKKQHDPTFDMDLSWWSGSATLREVHRHRPQVEHQGKSALHGLQRPDLRRPHHL